MPMKRILLLLVGVLVVGVAAGWPASAQQRETPRDLPAPPRLSVQEWGVWILEGGRVTVEELAAESPPFVVRAQAALRPPDGARPTPNPPSPRPPVIVRPDVTVRKPVVFFHASEPLDVTVDVRFRGGRPWLLYPSASEAQGNRLLWRGRVGGPGTPPAVDEGHWWNDLRAVGADGFETDRGGYERFVFYDGQVRFAPLFRFQRVGGAPEPSIAPQRGAEGPLFVVQRGRVVVHDVNDGRWFEAHRGAAASVLPRVGAALRARGLSDAETRALLDVWRDELLSPRPHAIYFVPRAAYDRMLPMRLDARTPSGVAAEVDLVRVGLVIERLSES